MKINFASGLKIEQKLQTYRCQFLSKNQTHVDIVVNKLHDSKINMFQPMAIKDQNYGMFSHTSGLL